MFTKRQLKIMIEGLRLAEHDRICFLDAMKLTGNKTVIYQSVCEVNRYRRLIDKIKKEMDMLK